ncbi:MAG: helix-turn-helix transcriptional regulator [Alphaproteobacteria bacterium]|jgi:phage repressor protein C with HTH and peptisase S24 domain|nr:helix-turn-helix transcriptional regulator [Alphaproteobacteria bacterium]MBF0355021.1 helix-turn-helix transcriptional regulator [Alphaproteobacteria bacterium]
MLRHADIWHAIDRLAFKNGMTASGLARKAGLDPTTFNKSKRTSPEGKLRWPSTESVSKVLAATQASVAEFVNLIDNPDETGAVQRIPLIGLAQAGSDGFFDDAGYPTGAGWDEIPFPEMGDSKAYALEISGDSMEPLYREGDTIILSPGAQIRRGDRVVLKTNEGEVMVKQLLRRTAKFVDLQSINDEHPNRSIPIEEVDWIHRVVWASQ